MDLQSQSRLSVANRIDVRPEVNASGRRLPPSYEASEQAQIWARLCDAAPEHFVKICKDILIQLDSGTFATTDLLILRHILDIECIRQQGRSYERPGGTHLREALLEPHIVVTAISYLSKRLIKHHNPDTPRTREWQLRALISAFALLSYHNATHISHTELTDIQRDLGLMTQDSHWQQKLTSDTLSHGACLYLVRLATDYSKAFRSDQPIWVTTIARVLNIAFAASASYAYDARRAVQELDEAFRPLWQDRQQRYKALRSLCELTRTTRIIRYWALALKPDDPPKAKQLYNLAFELARLSMAETLEILNNDLSLESQSPHNFLQALGGNLNATMSRSSNLDASSFMYGLLDNAAQLAQLYPIQSLNSDFTKRLLLVIEQSAVEQFQLKSMEIILISPQTRDKNFIELRHKIENEMVMKWIPARKSANQTILVNHLMMTHGSLDAHDVATNSFWLSLSRIVPLSQTPVLVETSPNRLQRDMIEPDYFDRQAMSPEGRITDIVSNASSSPPSEGPFRQSMMNIPGDRLSSVSSIGTGLIPQYTSTARIEIPEEQRSVASSQRISSISWHASIARTDIPGDHRSTMSSPRIGSLARTTSATITDCSYLCETNVFNPYHTALPLPPVLRQYPLAKNMFRQKNYFASAISTDCKHVVFMEEALAEVYEIPIGTWYSTPKEPVLRLKASKKELFRSVSLGISVLAIISGRTCSLHAIDGALPPQQVCIPIQIADWDPECVAFGNLDSRSIVAIGWRCGMAGTNETRGRLTVYEVPQHCVRGQLPVLISILLSDRDYPKFVGLSQDSSGLVTINSTTQRLNIVSAWRLHFQPPSFELMCSTARSFTAEVGVEGVTSTVTFSSPSGYPYILCTTSHSSERRKETHEGEFPFLAPAVTPFPKFGSAFFQPLTQFIHKPTLQAAAVPIQGSIIALLDRSGQIWLLPLELSEQNGLKTAETPDKMAIKLTTDLSGKAASLTFSPDGKKLVAADNRGNLAMFIFAEHEFSGPMSSTDVGRTSPVELAAPYKAAYEMHEDVAHPREIDGTQHGLAEMDGSGTIFGEMDGTHHRLAEMDGTGIVWGEMDGSGVGADLYSDRR